MVRVGVILDEGRPGTIIQYLEHACVLGRLHEVVAGPYQPDGTFDFCGCGEIPRRVSVVGNSI